MFKHPRSTNGLLIYLNCNNGYTDNAYNIYNYSTLEISQKILNWVTVFQLGANFNSTAAWRGSLYIVESLGSALYAARSAISFGTNFNPSVGWNWFDYSVPHTIPATGDFYLGIYSQTTALINANVAGNLSRARKTAAMVVDTEYTLTEQSAVANYLVGMRYKY